VRWTVAVARMIVLEVPMPEIAGFAFAEERHKYTAWRPIPIVFMTGKDITTNDRQRLHGLMDTALRTSEDSREEVLNKLRGLIRAYAHPLSTEGDEHHPPPLSSAPRGEAASTASEQVS
jgi:CheY-like chemotaxis protein